jgi:hypothetical protein
VVRVLETRRGNVAVDAVHLVHDVHEPLVEVGSGGVHGR